MKYTYLGDNIRILSVKGGTSKGSLPAGVSIVIAFGRNVSIDDGMFTDTGWGFECEITNIDIADDGTIRKIYGVLGWMSETAFSDGIFSADIVPKINHIFPNNERYGTYHRGGTFLQDPIDRDDTDLLI